MAAPREHEQEHGTSLSYTVDGESGVGDLELHEVEPITEEQRLRRLAGAGMTFLERLFAAGGAVTAEERQLLRPAVAVIGAWTRLVQSRSAENALNFSVAAKLATDKTELRRYVQITMPEHPMARALAPRRK